MTTNELLKRYESFGYPQKLSFVSKQCIRINPALISEKKLISRLKEKGVILEKVPFLTYGYYVNSPFPLSSSLEYLLGYFYIQEEPAQFVGDVIQNLIAQHDFANTSLLDCSAAPGGKLTHLSQLIRNKGLVVGVDPDKNRVEKLCYNVERMRYTNAHIIKADLLDIALSDYNNFDVVLLDAPCSGNFTQSKDWVQKRTTVDFQNRKKLQQKLIQKASTFVKKEGFLVYSTCSLEPEENEEVISWFVTNNNEFILQPIPHNTVGSPSLDKSLNGAKRFWPTQDKLPGFFIAVLKRV